MQTAKEEIQDAFNLHPTIFYVDSITEYVGKITERKMLPVIRQKTKAPPGFFIRYIGKNSFQHIRCDKIPTLPWFHLIRWEWRWHSFKKIWKTRRLDWWNAGIE